MSDERLQAARKDEHRPVDTQSPEFDGARPRPLATEMTGCWLALGRGLIKLLVSLLAGTGVGFTVFGYFAKDDPDLWRHRDPPFGLFLAVGTGLLTVAGMLVVLFFVPWWLRKLGPPGNQDH
jgi:hypothetical protein